MQIESQLIHNGEDRYGDTTKRHTHIWEKRHKDRKKKVKAFVTSP